jgi:hypothetical protein
MRLVPYFNGQALSFKAQKCISKSSCAWLRTCPLFIGYFDCWIDTGDVAKRPLSKKWWLNNCMNAVRQAASPARLLKS